MVRSFAEFDRMSNSRMRVILAAVVVLGLVSSGICLSEAWRTTPSTLNELSDFIRQVPGWGDKTKDAKLRLHMSQIEGGTYHIYIIDSKQGSECFIFLKSLQSKVSLQGWAGSREIFTNRRLGAFRRTCLDTVKLPLSVLMTKADAFANHREVKEKPKVDSTPELTKLAKRYMHGAETVGFFEFARAN